MNGPQRVVFGAWLAMVALSAVRSFGRGGGLPQPSVFLGSGVLFSVYLGAASFLGPLPAALAVGTDVAALMLPYIRGGTTGPLDQLAGMLDQISGGTKTAPASPGGSSGNLTP